MSWVLVVSRDEEFQREAVMYLRQRVPVVGATGEASARRLVRAIEVGKILVNASDEVGRRFLSSLRAVPPAAVPDVVVVGDDDGCPYRTEPDLRSAISLVAPDAA